LANKHKKLEAVDVAYTISQVDSPEEHVLHVLSNTPEQWKYDLLQMLLEGALSNQIGYMDAKHAVTGEMHRLLVGLELDLNGKINAYPIARLLDTEEATTYLAPDGRGNFDGNVAETVLSS
jgi:hypothetical protein